MPSLGNAKGLSLDPKGDEPSAGVDAPDAEETLRQQSPGDSSISSIEQAVNRLSIYRGNLIDISNDSQERQHRSLNGHNINSTNNEITDISMLTSLH